MIDWQSWSHWTQSSEPAPVRYRFKTPKSEPAAPASPPLHPHWFCAQLRDLVSSDPVIYQKVVDWLRQLEAQGHRFES